MQENAWLNECCAEELNDVSAENMVETSWVLYSQISKVPVSRSVEVNAGVASTYTRPSLSRYT
jgi:hypothetical protein